MWFKRCTFFFPAKDGYIAVWGCTFPYLWEYWPDLQENVNNKALFFSDGANSFDLARDERNIDNIQSTLYFIRCIREGFLIIMHCLKHLPTPVWGSAHLKG